MSKAKTTIFWNVGKGDRQKCEEKRKKKLSSGRVKIVPFRRLTRTCLSCFYQTYIFVSFDNYYFLFKYYIRGIRQLASEDFLISILYSTAIASGTKVVNGFLFPLHILLHVCVWFFFLCSHQKNKQ